LTLGFVVRLSSVLQENKSAQKIQAAIQFPANFSE